MIFVARKTIDVDLLPRVEIRGDELVVSLIGLGGTRPMSGLHDPSLIPGLNVLDQRVYRLSEFAPSTPRRKYLLLHDRKRRLHDPVDVFARFEGSEYASLFQGPEPLYTAAVLYQPRLATSFHDMHFVFCRPSLMKGSFEFYDEADSHLFSTRLMPGSDGLGSRLESLSRDKGFELTLIAID